MGIKRLLIPFLFICFYTGCIQDEPHSPYADIDSFALPADIALTHATINNNEITTYVSKGTNLANIVPAITISEGATIHPDTTEAQDFSQPVTYTVTAANGKHQRTYTVQTLSISFTEFNFEDWKALSTYAYETPVEYNKSYWDSSNKGISIYKQWETAAEFPIHKTTNAPEGKYAAEMETLVGPGNILNIVYIPVVAGSLFTGVFNTLNALKDPLTATQFGQPYYDKPFRLTGQYYYRAGTETYIAPDGKPRPEIKDSCAVYGVFFLTDENLVRLDGTNVLTHPNVVALAMLPAEGRAASPGEGFASFDIPFEYRNNHEVDFTKHKYKLGIVCSSSYYGDRYEGAPGSRLIVDDIKVIIEE